MRVVAGTHKGRRLKAPPGARPTADRVKEALFSILGEQVRGARVLDLFAGSGALGIEALSRGAAEVTFVDDSAAAARVIAENLPGARIARRSAAAYLSAARADGRQYDLVFLDPPYDAAPRWGRLLSEGVAAVLAPAGIAVCESDRRAPLVLEGLALRDERRYGDTLIRIHQHNE